MTKKFRLTIHHDDAYQESPDSNDEFWTLHSFSTSHRSFKDPDIVLACTECRDSRDQYQHTNVPQENDGDFKYADWAEEFRSENPEDLHEYQPPEGFLLSYFEHGSCRWGLAGSMSGMPDFQWDGVRVAGFLEIHPEVGGIDGDRTWYDSKTQDEKEEMASSFLEEYTDWANGEIYGYVLESLDPRECDQGYEHDNPEDLDSCWGFIGFDYFQEAVSEATRNVGATAENTEVVDEAYGMADYGDFFQPEPEPEKGVTA